MTGSVRFEGMYLNREPIFFDEGGLPSIPVWNEWLCRHRRSLKLLLEEDAGLKTKQITITISREN